MAALALGAGVAGAATGAGAAAGAFAAPEDAAALLAALSAPLAGVEVVSAAPDGADASEGVEDAEDEPSSFTPLR